MKSAKTEKPSTLSVEHQAMERLIFFSDAVFAIAITLLALDIRLPVSESLRSNTNLAAALLKIWPKYLGFIVSFLVIGSFWMSHHRKFQYIRRYDNTLLMLNLILLMVIAFIPFPTSIISEYGNRTATIFYALVIILAGLLSAAIWWYASSRNRLIDPQLDALQRRKETWAPLVTVAVFLLSIGLAFINDDLAKISWWLLAIAWPIFNRWRPS